MHIHQFDQTVRAVTDAPIADHAAIAHTGLGFLLLGCSRCRAVTPFPLENFRLCPAAYVAQLRDELAAAGWRLEAYVVHFLWHGLTLCLMDGLPNTWPDNHRWVSAGNEDDVTCPVCVESLAHRRDQQQAGRKHHVS